MREWNSDQKDAIETTDKGVVVSAAAGSGKTSVLVERTICMLSDPVNRIPADKLLAVTFTVDAATQLRQKLSKAFESKLKETSDPETKKWLRSQQDKLPLARISTINSFCLDLVKNNLNEFEFEEGVRIIDENDAEIVLNKAFDDALDKLAENNKDTYVLLYDKLGGSSASIKKYGRKLYSFLRSLPFPDEWFNSAVSNMTDSRRINSLVDAVSYTYAGFCEKAMKLNERARAYIDRFPVKDKKLLGNISALNNDLSIFNGMMEALEDGNWDMIVARSEQCFDSFSKTPPKKNDYSPELCALYVEIGEIRDESKKQFGRISKEIAKLGRDISSPMALSAEVLKGLREYSKIADELAYAEKLRKNALEFSDVEIMALKLLVKRENGKTVRTQLADELVSGGEYRMILIDEFQDVNNLQELIFKVLSDTDHLAKLGKNVFVVGDVKQSIYKFRLSNPKLFIDARNAASMDENKDKLKLIELKSNYRSRKNIVDFVNLMFSQLMSEEIGEIEYTGGDRLVFGAKYEGSDPDVDVIFVDAGEGDDDRTLSPDENYAIAQKIRQLLDDKVLVKDKNTDEIRPCRAGDFCVLYRSGDSAATLADALGRYGLKVSTEKSSGYLRSREIILMLSLLKVIDNPMHDIPMAAVMLSPLMGFTADELARIRLLCKRPEGGYDHIYKIVSSIGQKSSESHTKESQKLKIDDNVLESKCIAAKELVSRLGFYSAGMTISRLIRRIYDETEIVAAASMYENSRQKRANLRLLLEYASAYQENSDGSVSGFIRYLESVTECGKDLVQAVTTVEDNDSVVVKTIHSSKGLEYPFVFLCGITKQFRTDDLNDALLLDEYSGAGLVLTDRAKLTKTKTVAHAALSAIGLDQILSEELRLLYVAVTRAREHLIIPIPIKHSSDGTSKTQQTVSALAELISQAGGVNPRIVRDCRSYLEWITAALLCSGGREPFLERFGISAVLPTVSESAAIAYSEYVPDIDVQSDSPDFYSGKVLAGKLEQLRDIFEYKKNNTANAAASKMTVTEIVSAIKEKQLGGKNPEFFPSLPRLSDELEKLNSAQKGTCTHLFMELADYSSAEKSVRNELKRLTDEGFFTEKEASGVYISAVEKYFSGEFYQRVKRSDKVLREKKFLVSSDVLGLDEKYSEYLSDGSMLQGVADCIFSEDDSYVLVDYKTDNVTDVSELYNYKTQLELYKAALDVILDKPVKSCYIYSFRLNEGVEINM